MLGKKVIFKGKEKYEACFVACVVQSQKPGNYNP